MLTPAIYLFPVTVYVAFRSIRPDPVTWLDVLKKLLENNIDITQLRVWPTNHCQQAGPSTEEEVLHTDTGVRKEKKKFLQY